MYNDRCLDFISGKCYDKNQSRMILALNRRVIDVVVCTQRCRWCFTDQGLNKIKGKKSIHVAVAKKINNS